MPNDQEVALKITKLIPIGIDTLGIYSAILNALKEAREPLVIENGMLKEAIKGQEMVLRREIKRLADDNDRLSKEWLKLQSENKSLTEQVGRLEESIKLFKQYWNFDCPHEPEQQCQCVKVENQLFNKVAALVREG